MHHIVLTSISSLPVKDSMVKGVWDRMKRESLLSASSRSLKTFCSPRMLMFSRRPGLNETEFTVTESKVLLDRLATAILKEVKYILIKFL